MYYGRVVVKQHDNRIGVVLDIRCESEFGARTDEFTELCDVLATQAIIHNPQSEWRFNSFPMIIDNQPATQSVGEYISEVSGRLGEDITVLDIKRIEIGVL